MKKSSLSKAVSAPLAITLTTGLLIGGFAGAANAAPVIETPTAAVALTQDINAVAESGPSISITEAPLHWSAAPVVATITGLPANVDVNPFQSTGTNTWQGFAGKETQRTDENGTVSFIMNFSIASTDDYMIKTDSLGNIEETYRTKYHNSKMRFDYTDPVTKKTVTVPGTIKMTAGKDPKHQIKALPSGAYLGQTVTVSGTDLLANVESHPGLNANFFAGIFPQGTAPKDLTRPGLAQQGGGYAEKVQTPVSGLDALQANDSLSIKLESWRTKPGTYTLASSITSNVQASTEYNQHMDQNQRHLANPVMQVPDTNHKLAPMGGNKLGLYRDFQVYGASLDNTLGTEQGGNIVVTGSDYRPGDTVIIDVAGQSITTTVLSSGVFMAFIPTTTDTPVGDQTVTVTMDGAPTRTGSVEITEKYIPADGKDGLDGKDGIDGQDGEDGTNGTDGKSAYEIAVEGGFTGTEAEWLESLIGANGSDGQQGKSAYEIAVESGFEGTEKEWLESLQGTNGSDGKDGVNGEDGKPGTDGKDGLDGQPGLDGEDGTNGLDGKPGEDGLDGTNGQDGKPGVDGKDGIDGKDAQTPAPVDPTNKPADPAGNTDNGGNKTPAGTTDNGAVIKPVANVEKTGTEAPKPVTDGTEQVKINSGIAQDKAPLVYGGLAALAAAAAGAFALFRKRKPAVENNNHGDTSGN